MALFCKGDDCDASQQRQCYSDSSAVLKIDERRETKAERDVEEVKQEDQADASLVPPPAARKRRLGTGTDGNGISSGSVTIGADINWRSDTWAGESGADFGCGSCDCGFAAVSTVELLDFPVWVAALSFLRVSELMRAGLASLQLRETSEWECLWKELFLRRAWGGLLAAEDEPLAPSLSPPALLGKSSSGEGNSWKMRYRVALEAEPARLPVCLRSMPRGVLSAIRGPLAGLVEACDEEHRRAALCVLRRNPIVTDGVDAAIACVRRAKEEFLREDSDWLDPLLTPPLDVVPLDSVREDRDLEVRLSHLRSLGYKPLLDGLRCLRDACADEDRVRTALRAVVAETLICDTAEEAAEAAMSEQCSVVCCHGYLLVEYDPWAIPHLRWTEHRVPDSD
eukprot:TRINITY_DN48240_c0_g1_i1.p1 TRINITY_DN48240_c0_g1~~TRINITY_DN48240_c0_g1_i1.p1  ORF type:complete len:396 (+),score=69.66 TRINITY_DN48240_c0_g1_i1:169-1356(+)